MSIIKSKKTILLFLSLIVIGMFGVLYVISQSENVSAQLCPAAVQCTQWGPIENGFNCEAITTDNNCNEFQVCTHNQFCQQNSCVGSANCPIPSTAQCGNLSVRGGSFTLNNNLFRNACDAETETCVSGTCRTRCTRTVTPAPACPTACGSSASTQRERCTDNTRENCVGNNTCANYTLQTRECEAIDPCPSCSQEGNCPDPNNCACGTVCGGDCPVDPPEEVCEDIATPYGTPPNCRACPSADQTECSDGVCRLPANCPKDPEEVIGGNPGEGGTGGGGTGGGGTGGGGTGGGGTGGGGTGGGGTDGGGTGGGGTDGGGTGGGGTDGGGTDDTEEEDDTTDDTDDTDDSDSEDDSGTPTPLIQGSPPRVVPVANSTSKLKVSWTKHIYFDTYQVYYCKGTATQCAPASHRNIIYINANWTQKAGTQIGGAYSTTSVELTGLTPETRYWVMVLPYGRSNAGNRLSNPPDGDYSTRKSATTNKQCPAVVYCGVGTTVGGVSPAGSICTSCPPNPTIQNPTYSVNKETCNLGTTFKYSGGNRYKTGIIGVKEFGEKTYTPSDKGVSFYTLQPNDYNKTYTFYAQSMRSTDPQSNLRDRARKQWLSVLWGRATKQFTTPSRPHPKSNFTIEQIGNNQIQLQYTPENRANIAGLRFQWEFSHTPRFYNRTHARSANPRVSFDTTEPVKITLTTTDTNLPTTNGSCSSSQTAQPTTQQTSTSQMRTPTIDRVSYYLANAPICTPVAKIVYTSPEAERTDIINLLIGDTQVHTDRVNVSTPDTRSFIVPINANTIYKAIITTHDFQKTPTKDPSNPAEYIFTTPNTTTYPTANFTHNVNSNGTLSLNYTGTDTIQWSFREPVHYIQGSSTSKFIQVQFSTYGKKQVSLTATSPAVELNSCQYTQTIDVRATFTPSFPIIREVPPVRNR